MSKWRDSAWILYVILWVPSKIFFQGWGQVSGENGHKLPNRSNGINSVTTLAVVTKRGTLYYNIFVTSEGPNILSDNQIFVIYYYSFCNPANVIW